MTGNELIAVFADYQARRDEARDDLLIAVRRYARRVTASDEAAQETMTRVWQHLHRYDPERGSFAGWVRRIAKRSVAKRFSKPDEPVAEPVATDDKDAAVPPKKKKKKRTRGAKVDHLIIASTDEFREIAAVDRARPVPEKLRLLLQQLSGDDARLLTLALAGDGNLYRAGAQMGMTKNEVTHWIRRIKKHLPEKSQFS